MTDRQRATGSKPARVLIVDDHPVVREGLTEVINQTSDLAVCGEADSAADALEVIGAADPDVAVVDLSLRDSRGLDLIKDIRVRFPKLRVLVLTMRDETFYAERALRAGARGYVTKDKGTEEVVGAIRAVLAGEVYLSRQMAARMLRSIVPGEDTGGESPTGRLTDRELEVFRMIGTGLSTSEIAGKLHLSVKTIESYRERIKDKLGLDGAAELLKRAIQWAHGGQS